MIRIGRNNARDYDEISDLQQVALRWRRRLIGYIKHGTSFGRMQLSLNSIGNQSGSSLTNNSNLVYFQKDTRSSKVNSDWTIGRVNQVRRSKD